MIGVPPKLTKIERQTKRKSATRSPPLLTKYLWQSFSEFPIRDRKGKGKAKSFSDKDKEFKKIVNDTVDQILGALKIKDEGTSKLDYIITRALLSDNWFEKPRFANNNWFQGLTKHKLMPTSAQIKKLNERIPPIHEDKIHGCFKGMGKRDERITEKETKANVDSFIINIEKYRNVNHTPENLVWKIPGFCYLEVINFRVHRHTFWPTNPTVFTLAQFRPKYRQNVSFTLIETKPGSHFRIRTFPDNGMDGTMSWKCHESQTETSQHKTQ